METSNHTIPSSLCPSAARQRGKPVPKGDEHLVMHFSIIKRMLVVVLLAAVGAALSACNSVAPPVASAQAAQQAATSTPIPTAPAAAAPTYLVQRGDVQNILDFSGRWQPRDQMLLSFSTSGTVRRVNVRLNDTVTAGQLLADYQIDSLEQQLAQAKLSLETAKLNLNTSTTGSVTSVSDAQIALANAKISLQKTLDGSPWPQVESARISLDSARTSLAAAQRDYDDALSRPEQPASVINGAYDKLTSAKSQLRSAQASYDSAAQNYNSYKYQIDQAQNSVIQAQLSLQNAVSGGGVDPTRQQAVLSAQLNVDQLEAQIAQSSLTAPIDGEILQVAIKAGDAVKAYDTVITIGRSMPREAIASLAFSDAQKLSPGVVGICQILNRPETAVQCVVRRIPLNSRDADQTTRVAATLEDFKPATGQLIDIQMPLQVSKNVLWLPPVAVRTFQNRTFVVLQTPNGPRSVDVTVGLRTTDRVEITSGLKEGDIAVGP